ncbi:MAG TPA: hypothetical protein VJ732_07760 [Bryobacteraceae bacterium]|nr:hypothetical protein [Bryobacteraceae bacterium]
MILAILRAQLLSMRLGMHRGAAFSILTAVLWYGFWCFVAASAATLASQTGAAILAVGLPAALLLICVYWQVVPILSASMGSALDMRKLLIYPVPPGKLFAVEVLLRFTTGVEMVLVLAGGVAGLLENPETGGWRAAPRILLPAVLFALFNLLLASGLRSLLERLLSRRKLREALIFLVLLGLTLPRLLVATGEGPSSLHQFDLLIRFAVLPWTVAPRVMTGASEAAGLAVLAAWTLAAGWFGRRQFGRNLRYDASAAQATVLEPGPRRAETWSERFYRFPGALFGDPLAGLIEKELRSLARTPRFRMVFVMGFSFGFMVWLPLVIGRRAVPHSALEQNFLVLICVYAMTLLGQVSYWNCFGFDRSAVLFYYAAPQPMSQILLAKNLAALVFVYLEVAILTLITLALRVGIGPGKLLETLVVVGICCLYMMAFGNLSSVRYPRALTPERVSQGGASSRFQALVFILYPLALLPVFLAYLARYAFDSQAAFVAVLAFAAAVGVALYWIATESAVATATRQRERILSDLSRGEGPVVSD